MTARASTSLAVAAGLGAASAYGIASAVQHDQAGKVATKGPLDPALIGSLAKRPIWLLGLVADAAAVALQAVALRFGAVVLVQLLVVAGLPVAVVISARVSRQRLSRSDVLGLVLCTGGLAAAVPGSTTVNLGHPAAARTWLVVGAAAVIAVLALLGVGRRRPTWAPGTTGAAAGITAGASSILLAVCAARIDHPVALLKSVAPYAALLLGLTTLLLSQAAFQTGAIGTPLAALSVTEPAVAVAMAVTVLRQRLPSSVALASMAALGAAVAVSGVIVLSRSARLQRPVAHVDPA